MALGDEKYMLLTTFKRGGAPVPSPVWVVPLDGGTVGFYTSSGSGKAKRLAHTARVTVQPSDARGRTKPGSQPVDATENQFPPFYQTVRVVPDARSNHAAEPNESNPLDATMLHRLMA